MGEDSFDKLIRLLEMGQYKDATALVKEIDHRGEDKVMDIFSLIEKGEYGSALIELYDFFGLSDENEENYEDEEINPRHRRGLSYDYEDQSPKFKSPDESPYYNDNLDMDQQSPEFWDDIG